MINKTKQYSQNLQILIVLCFFWGCNTLVSERQVINTDFPETIKEKNISFESSLYPQRNKNFGNIDRFAMIIGNKNYDFLSSLKNPHNDAIDMNNILQEFGFSAKKYYDIKTVEFDFEIDSLIEKAKESMQKGNRIDIVFYYAGHGVSYGGINYLLPSDFPQRDPKPSILNRFGINLSGIISQLTEVADRTIILLDSCRNDPFEANNGSRSLSKDISVGMDTISVRTKKNFNVFYCAGLKQTAKDFLPSDDPLDRNNGVCTRYLLNEMKNKEKSFSEIVNSVQTQVYNATSEYFDPPQIPGIYDQMRGSFFFDKDRASTNYLTFLKIGSTKPKISTHTPNNAQRTVRRVDIPPFFGQSLSIFFRHKRLNDAQKIKKLLESQGAFINLINTNLSEVTLYPKGTTRLVHLINLTKEEKDFLNTVKFIVSVTTPNIKISKLKSIKNGPIQIQLF